MTLSASVGLPFVGFGFADNFIMILAGDYLDSTIGVKFGLSTMAAAGIGNLISDVVGLSLGEIIEAGVARVITSPPLSHEQLNLRAVRLVKASAGAVGISVGCIIGMFPLLFMHDRKAVFFDDDELALFQLQFAPYGVSGQQFFELLKHGKWHSADAGTVLVRQGEPLHSTIFLHYGAAKGASDETTACIYEGRTVPTDAEGANAAEKRLVPSGISEGASRLRKMRTVAYEPEPQPSTAISGSVEEVSPRMARGSIIGGTALVEPDVLGLPYPHTVTLTRKTKYLEWRTSELREAMREDKHLEAAVLNTLYRDLMHAKREQKKLHRKVRAIACPCDCVPAACGLLCSLPISWRRIELTAPQCLLPCVASCRWSRMITLPA